MGDPAPGEAAPLRLPVRRRGRGEPGPAVPGRGGLFVPSAARRTARHQGHRRSPGRVLAAAGAGTTFLPGDPPVPAEEDARLRSRLLRLDLDLGS